MNKDETLIGQVRLQRATHLYCRMLWDMLGIGSLGWTWRQIKWDRDKGWDDRLWTCRWSLGIFALCVSSTLVNVYSQGPRITSKELYLTLWEANAWPHSPLVGADACFLRVCVGCDSRLLRACSRVVVESEVLWRDDRRAVGSEVDSAEDGSKVDSYTEGTGWISEVGVSRIWQRYIPWGGADIETPLQNVEPRSETSRYILQLYVWESAIRQWKNFDPKAYALSPYFQKRSITLIRRAKNIHVIHEDVQGSKDNNIHKSWLVGGHKK